MSYAHHNPAYEGQIRKMYDNGRGMKPTMIARQLKITRSSVYWYIYKWLREAGTYEVDDTPPAVERFTCKACHGRSATDKGHPSCTGRWKAVV